MKISIFSKKMEFQTFVANWRPLLHIVDKALTREKKLFVRSFNQFFIKIYASNKFITASNIIKQLNFFKTAKKPSLKLNK